ncbi:MAG: hypothetical protein QNK05_02170 [Myxococcota bacterium]|nr:hypothetical protein [Myxococcota bacterium]
MQLLALDFDGVISDSAREAFAVAVRTHLALDPARELRGGEGDAALYRGFLELMPLGNRAEDFFLALEILRRGARVEDQAGYDAFRAGYSEEALRAFHRRFYQERTAWSEADPDGWLREMGAYPEIPALLERLSARVELAIATAKDRRSVRRLVEAYGVSELFSEGSILDKETGVHKSAHVRLLAGRSGIPPRDITFVDDKVNHLEDVAPTGARCGLATWGYNGEREYEQAREQGYLLLSLETLEQQLFAAAESNG